MLKGGIDNWFKVVLPDGSSGFISSSLIESTESPIDQKNIAEETLIYDFPGLEAVPVAGIIEDSKVAVLAQYGSLLYVKSEDGDYGWIISES